MTLDKTLTRTVQIGTAIEVVEGTAATLVAADYAGEFSEIDFGGDTSEYEPGTIRPSLSNPGVIKGQSIQSKSYTRQLKGGSASARAKWFDDLEMCGFRVGQLSVIEITSPSNADQLRTGQTIGNNASLGSATATGIFAYYEAGSPNRLWYIPLVGEFASAGTVSNYTGTQFSGTINSNPALNSWYAQPASDKFGTVRMVELTSITNEELIRPGAVLGDNATQGSATKQITVVHFEPGSTDRLYYFQQIGDPLDTDDTLHGYGGAATVQADVAANAVAAAYPRAGTIDHREGGRQWKLIAARATGSLTMRLGEPLRISVEATGILDLDSNGDIPTAAPVSSVPALVGAAKAVKGAPLTFKKGSGAAVTPVLTELVIDFGNTVSPRPTITDAALESSGYLGAVITDRQIRAQIDPERLVGAVDLEALTRSDDTFEILIDVGATGDTHGKVVVLAPAAQAEGGLTPGERDGMRTTNMNTRLTGDDDDELYIFHIFN